LGGPNTGIRKVHPGYLTAEFPSKINVDTPIAAAQIQNPFVFAQSTKLGQSIDVFPA